MQRETVVYAEKMLDLKMIEVKDQDTGLRSVQLRP